MRMIPAMLLAVGIAWAENCTANENYTPQVGEKHSAVTLPRISDRQPVSLADFRGKKVLLIHFASW